MLPNFFSILKGEFICHVILVTIHLLGWVHVAVALGAVILGAITVVVIMTVIVIVSVTVTVTVVATMIAVSVAA